MVLSHEQRGALMDRISFIKEAPESSLASSSI